MGGRHNVQMKVALVKNFLNTERTVQDPGALTKAFFALLSSNK